MIIPSHRNYRRDILNFYDACRNGQKHTKEQFDFIIHQCDCYEKYIQDHDIKNGIIEVAIKEIRRLYESWTLQDTLNRMIEEEIKDAKKLIDDTSETSIDSIPKPLLCPNCGAPLHGHKCEYCDTEFIFTTKSELQDRYNAGLISANEYRKLIGLSRMDELYSQAIQAFRHYHS